MKTTILGISLFAVLTFVAFKTDKTVTYKADTKKSTVVWTGKKVTGEHKGTVPLSSGSILTEDKKIKSGTFEINMAGLTVTDITDKDGNAKLVGHLKSNDFFSTDKFPTATYVITSVDSKGGDSYTVNGNLTIKGITNPVSFPATIKVESKTLIATGTITVDRTKFDIKYKSSSFFDSLGDKAILDNFTLDVNLVAAI